MSHRMRRRELWHDHCNYNKQKRTETGPKKVEVGKFRNFKESMGSAIAGCETGHQAIE